MSEDILFILRVVASFIIGGTYIAATTVVAERVSAKLAGILVSLPTTVLVAYSFLTLTTSLEDSGNAAGSAPAVIGGSVLFLLVYVEMKDRPIILKLLAAISMWLVMATVIAVTHTTNVFITVSICIACVLLVAYRFHSLENHAAVKIHYTKGEVVTRFILAGSVIALAIILARVSGTIWGAVFSAFPATFTSTLIILDRRHGYKMIASMAKTMPYGSLGTALFSVVFHFLSRIWPFIPTLLTSYAASAVFTFAIVSGRDYFVRKATLQT